MIFNEEIGRGSHLIQMTDRVFTRLPYMSEMIVSPNVTVKFNESIVPPSATGNERRRRTGVVAQTGEPAEIVGEPLKGIMPRIVKALGRNAYHDGEVNIYPTQP
jgi:hypothetical protein